MAAPELNSHTQTAEPAALDSQTSPDSKPPTVCLVGMPNAGKTALMNALTGGSFRTANYPGVTVTLSKGRSKRSLGPVMSLVDLPGVHSGIAPSPEEELSCQVIEGKHPSVIPDGFVLVIDATQLERHLKFAAYAARSGKPVVIALTMTDLLARAGSSLDARKLEAALLVPVVEVDGRTGWGADVLIKSIAEALSSGKGQMCTLASIPEEPVEAFQSVRSLLAHSGALKHSNPFVLVTDAVTSRIDRIVLNRYWGFPIFFVALVVLFASIFWVAQPFMDLIEAGFGIAADFALRLLPEGVLSRFIAQGIIGGVGSVAVFFPQIIILFFLMTLLEDSGYLARGAALVDRPLSALGLHGRSFVPMLSGFACAIPAVLAARTIPNRRERLLTIWILPLMSCSARLPVYALLLAALLPDAPLKAGLALAGIYISSLLVGALTAGLISRLILRKREPSVLAMELPTYRKPLIKPTLKMTWTRGSAYLKRAGTPIIVISAVLWLLSNFGLGSHQQRDVSGVAPRPLVATTDLEHSFAGELGHTLEPVLRPMGVDWRVGVGLIAAFAAREVFVSSLAIIFHAGDAEEGQQARLLQSMSEATFHGSTQRIFTPATIVGLIVFFFFSLQCLSTVAVVRSETNSWRLAGLQLLFYTGIGYIAASAAVQGLRAIGVA